MRVLVTGAGGFIGRAFVAALQATNHTVQALSRSVPFVHADYPEGLCPSLSDEQLEALCRNQQAVVHLAGIAHGDAVSEAQLLRYNAELTGRLFRAAARVGVERFVYLSSSKVLGDGSVTPLMPTADLDPQDLYARSKAVAEQQLRAAGEAATQLLIIRPPLVYGPGVRANYARLLWLAALPVPLPLGAATAPRSFISRTNLVAGLGCALSAPAGIYHLADPDPWSTATMVTALRAAAGRRSGLVAVSPGLVAGALRLTGRRGWFVRLFEPAVLDCVSSYRQLGFEPAPGAAHVAETMRCYLAQR